MPASRAVHIHRLSLRGATERQASVTASLGRATWPRTDPDEVLLLRRLEVSGDAAEIGGRASLAAERLAAHAVDGRSPEAATAPAVRFRNLPEMLSCLVRDLLGGERRWFWREWQGLFDLPLGDALARALATAPLRLPEVLDRLDPATTRAVLWRALAGPPAGRLYDAVVHAAGWRLPPSREPLPPPQEGDAFVPNSTAAPPFATTGHDASLRLAALLIAWQRDPALLTRSSAGPRFSALCTALTGGHAETAAAPSQTVTAPSRAADAGPAAATRRRDESPRTTTVATPATLAPVGTGEALTDIAQVPSYPRPKAHRSRTGGHAPERQGREEPRPEPIAVVRPAPDRTIVTRAGGLFYLLNFLKIPAAQAHLEGESTPGLRGGWVWLYRLGTVLGLDADEALMRFLASEAGLDAGRSLAALPGLSSEPDLLRLGETRFGPALWGPGLFPVPAVLRCATTHLDVHFRLGDARLDVRRAGLDTDPGWLPWLGKVVAFHFGHPPELSGEGGAW